MKLVSFWCTRWGFAVSASQNLGKASALRFSREPWLLTFTAGYKKHPIWGVLVYPLGFEPRLDGVGGRNVIQLHYEYLS